MFFDYVAKILLMDLQLPQRESVSKRVSLQGQDNKGKSVGATCEDLLHTVTRDVSLDTVVSDVALVLQGRTETACCNW